MFSGFHNLVLSRNLFAVWRWASLELANVAREKIFFIRLLTVHE